MQPPAGPGADPAWTAPVPLLVATWLVVAESVAGAVVVAYRSDLGPAAKVLLVGVFACKIGFARLARAGVAGGVLAVLVFEVVGIPIALASSGPVAARLALAVTVVVVFVLIGRSLRAFPPPSLPDLRSGPPR